MQAMEKPAARHVTDDARPRHHRWRGSLAVHLLAYVVLLLALLAVGPIGSWTSDDGSYAVQAMTLERTGGWAMQHPLGEDDPTGAHFSFQGAEHGEDGWYVYVKHPAWIMVLSVAHRLGGSTGLFLPSLLGAVGAAAAAWCVAGLSARRLSIPAFWLVGLGPIGAQSTGLWAHAPSAALAGWATYAAVSIVRRGPSLRRSIGLAAALSGGVLVRSEVPIFAIALLAALGGYWLVRGGERRSKAALRSVGVPCVAVLAVVLAELRWVAAIMPRAASSLSRRGDNESYGWLEGRIHGAASSLLLPWLEVGSVLLGLAGVVLLVLAGRALASEGTSRRSGAAEPGGDGGQEPRSDRMPSPGTMLAMGGLAVLAVHDLIYLRQPVAGLAPAWPLAVVGLAAWRWSAAPAAERVLAVTAGLFSLGVLATQYSAGGGLDWGGRFFACLAVPLAALVVGTIDRLWEAEVRAGQPVRRPLLAAITVLGLLVPAGAAVVTTESLRRDHAEVVDRIVATDATTVVSLVPPINRLAWRTVPEIRWVSAVDIDDVRGVLDDLARLGERRVLILGGGISTLDAPGWHSTSAGQGLLVLDRIGA